MERAGRRAKAGSLSGLSGGLPSGLPAGLPGGTPSVRRQRSLEWGGDRYSSSDEDRPQKQPQLDDRVFASLLAQATQQFDSEQRRMYGSENGENVPRYISSPQRQASPFPLESTNRRFHRRIRNSKGEEIFNSEAGGGTLSRRTRRSDDFQHDTNGRGNRINHMNGPSSGGQSERECDSPPEPAPPEVPPRGPSLHVTLRHRAAPDQNADSDRLFLSEEFVMSEGGHGGTGTYPARSPISSSTTGHSSSSHHSSLELISLYDISPAPNKKRKPSNRGSKTSVAAPVTSSPYKNDLIEQNKKKKEKKIFRKKKNQKPNENKAKGKKPGENIKPKSDSNDDEEMMLFDTDSEPYAWIRDVCI